MNRREFLKTWIAIGGVCSVPLNKLQAATDQVIEIAWRDAQENVITFYANSRLELSDRPGLEGFRCTQDRRDLFRLGATPSGGQALIDFIRSNTQLDDVAWHAHSDFSCDYGVEHDGEDCPWCSWEEWALSGECAELVSAIDDWLDEYPDDCDYAHADINGLSCRGDAVYFFRERPESAELLGVVVSDSGHGWTPDFCVWLKHGVDEANRRAVAHELPIRFEGWEG